MGTPAYMPPEQIRDASSVDGRADVFALGCILYELVAGHPAFDGDDPIDIFDKVRAGAFAPIPDRAPPAVAHTIRACLATDRDQRLPDVRSVQKSLSSEAPAPLPVDTSSLPTSSPAWIGGAAVVVAVGVLAGSGSILGLLWAVSALTPPTCEAPADGWVQLAGGGLPRDGADWVARSTAPLHDEANGSVTCTLPTGTQAKVSAVAEPLDPDDPWVRLAADGMELASPDALPVDGLPTCYGPVSGWAVARSFLTRPKRGAETWTVRPTQPLLADRPTETNGWSSDHPASCELASGSKVTIDPEHEQVRGHGTWVHVRRVE
jgi:hypothetical protein